MSPVQLGGLQHTVGDCRMRLLGQGIGAAAVGLLSEIGNGRGQVAGGLNALC